jgi:hypothetical protein
MDIAFTFVWRARHRGPKPSAEIRAADRRIDPAGTAGISGEVHGRSLTILQERKARPAAKASFVAADPAAAA